MLKEGNCSEIDLNSHDSDFKEKYQRCMLEKSIFACGVLFYFNP